MVAYGDVIGHNFTAVDVVLREMVRVCAPRGLISFEIDSKWCPDLLYLPKELWQAMTTRGGHLFPPSLLFRQRRDAPGFDALFRRVIALDLRLGKMLRCGSTRIVTVEKP